MSVFPFRLVQASGRRGRRERARVYAVVNRVLVAGEGGVRKVGRCGQRRELCLQVTLPLGRSGSEEPGGGREPGGRRAPRAGPGRRAAPLRARAASARPGVRSDWAGNERTTSPSKVQSLGRLES